MLTNMDVNLRQAKRVWNVDKNYYRSKKRIVCTELIVVCSHITSLLTFSLLWCKC